MKYLLLFVGLLVLAGCMSDDWRAAIAQERVVVAENVRTAQNAQIERGQQSDMDRRDANAMLLALQAQNAMVQGQTAQAQALAQVEIARTIAQAAKPDYMPLMVAMGCVTLLIVVWLLAVARRRPVAVAPKLLSASTRYEVWRLPDNTIEYHRLADGKVKAIAAK